jgi:hypothetical protein
MEVTEEDCGICGRGVWWDGTPNPICNDCTVKRSETESTDRLIAAAPDLLAALVEIYSGWDRGDYPLPARFIDMANAAIAKAEGR